ncbi:MAG: dUTP diphosphatase [Bacteroidota bacterium]
MTPLPVKIVNRSPHPLPAYATEGSSGLDLRAFLPEAISLGSLQRQLIPTGLFIELPVGYEAQIRPRSGLALKQGLTCLNSPGTIDSDYRGEIKVLLINLSDVTCVIQDGDRIAQLVVQAVERISWMPCEDLNETSRAEGGFGHTGKQ